MQIKRDIYLQKLIDRMGSRLIKVITGVRRCGKSYLLFELFRSYLLGHGVPADHIVSMAFDSIRNREYRDPLRLMEYLDQHIGDDGTYYCMLDEVQLLDDFPEVLNTLLQQTNVDIYVTGSNSKFLSSDVITELRGRGDEIHVFPLSFAEFMQAYDGETYQGWAQYLRYGGLPLVVTDMRTAEQRSHYLSQLFRETYIKDIRERNRLDRESEMEALLDVLASSIGSLTNPAKIQATFQSRLKSSISVNTIHRYIGFLEDAFLIHEAKRYDVKGRKYIGTPVKYYFEDVGLRNARINFRQVEETHLMENVLYNELRLRGYNVDVGSVTKRCMDKVTQKRVSKQLEIDFVANLGSKRYYIQSAYRLPDEEKLRQEKASLLALDDSFKKIIVVSDLTTPVHDDDGILTMNIFDFLLNQDSLEA